jgi:ketosteroid isomerase-like protein
MGELAEHQNLLGITRSGQNRKHKDHQKAHMKKCILPLVLVWLGGRLATIAAEELPLNPQFEPPRPSLPLAGGDALKSETLNDDVAAISEAIREFAVTFNEGNLQKFMDVFSEDFVSMGYGRHTVSGKEALEEWRSSVQVQFTKYNRHLEITTDEIRVSGTMGFERGSVKVSLTPKSGGPANRRAPISRCMGKAERPMEDRSSDE